MSDEIKGITARIYEKADSATATYIAAMTRELIRYVNQRGDPAVIVRGFSEERDQPAAVRSKVSDLITIIERAIAERERPRDRQEAVDRFVYAMQQQQERAERDNKRITDLEALLHSAQQQIEALMDRVPCEEGKTPRKH